MRRSSATSTVSADEESVEDAVTLQPSVHLRVEKRRAVSERGPFGAVSTLVPLVECPSGVRRIHSFAFQKSLEHMAKITVVLASTGEEFCVSVSHNTTFADIRSRITTFWGLQDSSVPGGLSAPGSKHLTLEDPNGTIWPDKAVIGDALRLASGSGHMLRAYTLRAVCRYAGLSRALPWS